MSQSSEQGRKCHQNLTAAKPLKKRRHSCNALQLSHLHNTSIPIHPVDSLMLEASRQQQALRILAQVYYLPVIYPNTNNIFSRYSNILTTPQNLNYALDTVSIGSNLLLQGQDYSINADVVQSTQDENSSSMQETETQGAQESADSDSVQTLSQTHDIGSITTMTLFHPSDEQRLSSLQCRLREQIEFFTATSEDVDTYSRGRNKNVKVGQVGIRCIHCSAVPVKDRSKGSSYFPSTLTGIYQAAQNMHKYHICLGKTGELQVEDTMSSKSCDGGGKGYWSTSAELMGVIETGVGLRLRTCGSDMDRFCYEVDQSSLRQIELATKDDTNIINPNDKSLTTDYIFMLFSQLSTSNRPAKKGNLNRMPGLICKHCNACDESGAFFRKKVSSLSKNENLDLIDCHLSQCRYCPDEIKVTLKKLKELHDYHVRKLKRGDRKKFFTRIITRMNEQTL